MKHPTVLSLPLCITLNFPLLLNSLLLGLMDRTCINVMAVGDANCGKSCLLNIITKNKALDEDPTTIFNYEVDIEVDENQVKLSLFSTAGELEGRPGCMVT